MAYEYDKDTACKTYGSRFRLVRALVKMEQQEAAARAGLSQSQLSMIERGLYEPKARTLIAYSRLYGCSIDFLLGLTNSTSIRGGGRIEL